MELAGFKQLLELVTTYGFPMVVTSIVLFFGVRFFALKFKNDRAKYMRKRLSNLTEHLFFERVKYIIRIKLPMVKIVDKCSHKIDYGRTEIFKDMLSTKINIWGNRVEEFCNNNFDNVSKKQISVLFQDLLLDVIRAYEQEWKSDDIPDIVISKFNEWHKDHVSVLFDAIESISNSNYFDTSKEVIFAILSINLAILMLTIVDAERTLNDLNGQLSGIKYKKYKLT